MGIVFCKSEMDPLNFVGKALIWNKLLYSCVVWLVEIWDDPDLGCNLS